ncbi:MAG: galactose-1-phosphate uridylyltransferase [Actinomycetota bacterium]|nr:galactose-1-phosphate uridylyltransferase [Actinomycetota bacterium]MDQ6945189.1 galactose-1-phosphate uridylyltransferase [Actinomycetota bacterium]
MKKTHARLADGREIIYFDEANDAVRDLVDQRALPPPTATPIMRYDVLADEWVAVTAHRQDRTYLPPDDDCPLCPSGAGRRSEIPSADYDVVVFENRFSSFAPSSSIHDRAPRPRAGMHNEQPALGRCEVVCFTSAHGSSFSALSPARVRTVVEAWVDRTSALSEAPAVAQVFIFENRGREIGVTLTHPHGQIYGYPFVTPRTRRMLAASRRYRADTGRSLFEDVVSAEVAAGVRIVTQTEHWTAFVPYAARWPIEVHVYPNQPGAWLPQLSDGQRHDFCAVYLDVLRRLEVAHGADLPYISAWHQAPVQPDQAAVPARELACLHLEICSIRRSPGRLKYLAGSETAMGAFLNDVAPEQAARALQEAGGG